MKTDKSKWDGKTITMRKITELRLAEYNPRQLTKKQFADIKASLTRYGFMEPIVINGHPTRKDVIIGGHQRVKVAAEMGIVEVPCVSVALDEKRERELIYLFSRPDST
jgi:ParB-like chromosome segregation protein Spo0J